jgi:glycosyltransferase involved in cell wall biosynthesis
VDDTDEYHRWLSAADIVVSTAEHEFQGLAVMEAVISGCLPLAPDRLVYPELYPQQFLYESSPADPAGEAQAAVARLLELAHALAAGVSQPPALSDFRPDAVKARYVSLFQELAG